MQICTYTPDRMIEIVDLFYRSVHAIHPSVYTERQKALWAPISPNYTLWSQRLINKKPYLAIINNQLVGFMSLERMGNIGWAYTHPNFQRKGVASTLYDYILKIAQKNQYSSLKVEASIIALPFFEKKGFCIVKENKLEFDDEILINYTMKLNLEY